MPKHLPPELKQKVRALYEGSTLTHAQIGAEAGVAGSTVSVWGAAGGWTRPPGARVTARLVLAQRATVARLSRNGARHADVAVAVGCHRRTVGRIAAARPVPADEGPQTFDETNELLEELAIRLGEWKGEVQEREDRERRERLLARAAQDEPLESSGTL